MLRVPYKCYCMDAEATVEVPERPEGADLMLWMDVMGMTLRLDHSVRSPRCRSETVEYVKIPYDEGAAGVGMKIKLQS